MENKTNEQVVAGIYCDLDSLVDTRHTLLYYLDPELATELLSNGQYYNRLMDSFKYINKSIFTPLYKDRNKSILKLTAPTNILHMLKSYFQEVSTADRMLSGSNVINYYINTYPYKLNEEETKLLSSGIVASISDKIVVEVMYKNPAELTPKWFISRCSTIIMYEGLQWLEYHVSTLSFAKTTLPETILITPALIVGNDISLLKLVKDYNLFFKSVEESISTFINLNMVPVREFSIME